MTPLASYSCPHFLPLAHTYSNLRTYAPHPNDPIQLYSARAIQDIEAAKIDPRGDPKIRGRYIADTYVRALALQIGFSFET